MWGWSALLELSIKWCWSLFQHWCLDQYQELSFFFARCWKVLRVCRPFSGALNLLADAVWKSPIILRVAGSFSPRGSDMVLNQSLVISSDVMWDFCSGYFDCFPSFKTIFWGLNLCCIMRHLSVPWYFLIFLMSLKIISKSFFTARLVIEAYYAVQNTRHRLIAIVNKPHLMHEANRCCHDNRAFQKQFDAHATPVKNISLAFISSGREKGDCEVSTKSNLFQQ